MSLRTAQMDSRRRAALLGIAAGLRTQIPLAHLIHASNQGGITLGHAELDRWLRHPRLTRVVAASTIGELFADKLPFVPPRTDPAPLAGRLLFGGIAGAVGARSLRGSLAAGGALGAVAAGLSAMAGTTLRRTLPRFTGLPDAAVAIGEDTVAYLVAHKSLSAR